jgi:ubiquinone/menaquinone biosynthesis C-methylase UbiE
LREQLLHGLQSLAAKAANWNQEKPSLPSSHDLLKAKLIAQRIAPNSSLVDIGAGNGTRIRDIAIYVDGLDGFGLELGIERERRDDPLGMSFLPAIFPFNGETLPLEENEVDYSMLCYVLHHLSEARQKQLLREALRVTTKRVFILEDSLSSFNWLYRIRNFAHIAQTNLEYSQRSKHFQKVGTNGFKTHQEWEIFLRQFDEVAKVEIVPLSNISTYKHHTLLVIEMTSNSNDIEHHEKR